LWSFPALLRLNEIVYIGVGKGPTRALAATTDDYITERAGTNVRVERFARATQSLGSFVGGVQVRHVRHG